MLSLGETLILLILFCCMGIGFGFAMGVLFAGRKGTHGDHSG